MSERQNFMAFQANLDRYPSLHCSSGFFFYFPFFRFMVWVVIMRRQDRTYGVYLFLTNDYWFMIFIKGILCITILVSA